MQKLSYEKLLEIRKTPEEAMSSKRHPITLILDNIRSAYNVGSIFRTADSALAEQVILCGYTPSPPQKEVLKTALGATESVPWKYYENITDAIKSLKNKGVKVFALELTDDSISYTDLKIEDYPIAIILGNEISGVCDAALELCDAAIEIPMYGVKHSLNVGVSTGIALFESVRKYLES